MKPLPDHEKSRQQLLFELHELREQIRHMVRFQPHRELAGAMQLRHLEKVNMVEKAIRSGRGLEQVMTRVVDALREAFGADQVFLMTPCDPKGKFFKVPYRSCHPEHPLSFPPETELPLDREIARFNELALDSEEPLQLGPTQEHDVPAVAKVQAGAQSTILVALHPDVGPPWLMGMHQCAFPREWMAWELRLFKDLSGRVTDTLTNILLTQDLAESRQHLKTLSAELFREQEEQGKRFAREIHDDLGQPLVAIKVGLDNALYDLGDKGESGLRQWLISAAGLAKSLVDRIRMMQEALYPSTLQDFGLLVALDGFLDDFRHIYPGLVVNKAVLAQKEDIPDQLGGVILRIVQEALYNTAKHSRADSVSVALDRRDARLRLAIRDNGRGFDTGTIGPKPGARGGLGLPSMQERAEMTGGVFSIHSSPDKGTFIQIEWVLES